MTELAVHIDRLVLAADGPMSDSKAATRLLEDALALLAEKLRHTPFERWGDADQIAALSLQLEDISIDQLLTPSGAEILAKELYSQLVNKIGSV